MAISGGTGFILAIAASRLLLHAHTAAEVGVGLVIGTSALALFGLQYPQHRAKEMWLFPLFVSAGVLVSVPDRECAADELDPTASVGIGLSCGRRPAPPAFSVVFFVFSHSWTSPRTSRFWPVRDSMDRVCAGGRMRGQPGFFDIEERLRELSAKGDELERLNSVVDFELFRRDLERAVPRSDRSKGGRPAFDHMLMFKVLIVQASHSLSDERTEYLIKDRLSFMRFLGLSLANTVPDANTIWTFREALTRAKLGGKPAIEVLFKRFDTALSAAGFLAMGGQIIDATIVATPKQRNSDGEKREIKEGRIPAAWAGKPAKLRQKDRDARWTVKYTKAKPSEDGAPRVDLAVPAFGYKNHIGIDRRRRLGRHRLSLPRQ